MVTINLPHRIPFPCFLIIVIVWWYCKISDPTLSRLSWDADAGVMERDVCRLEDRQRLLPCGWCLTKRTGMTILDSNILDVGRRARWSQKNERRCDGYVSVYVVLECDGCALCETLSNSVAIHLPTRLDSFPSEASTLLPPDRLIPGLITRLVQMSVPNAILNSHKFAGARCFLDDFLQWKSGFCPIFMCSCSMFCRRLVLWPEWNGSLFEELSNPSHFVVRSS